MIQFTAAVFLTGASFLPAVALAQASDAASDTEIVVTAQKREQLASDVPISMTAMSGAELDRRGVNSTLDLANYVPGLAIGQNTGDGDFPFISLRGVSMRDFADTNESPSAVYIDDFYKANLMGLDGQTFDLDRVEVLRGPQGTLYGRNATGGLIKFVTKKPGDTLDGYVTAQYGSYNEIKVEGAVGGPIANGISARISAVHHEHDGWLENIYPGRPDGNALDTTAVRGQLLIEPTDSFSALATVQYYKNDNDAGNLFGHSVVAVNAQGLAVANPNPAATDSFGYRQPVRDDPRFTNSDRDAYLKSEQLTATGRLEYKAGDVSLISVTGYEWSKKDQASDSDSSPFDIRGTEAHPRGKQFSQELRAQGESGPVTWIVGGYYLNYHVYGYQKRYRGPVIGFRPNVTYDLKTDSYALFANADWSLGDVTLTGGLRYSKEKKKYALTNGEFGVVFNETTAGALAKQDDDNVSFNARVSYKPVADTLLYAGVARSYKGGTFNVGYTAIAFNAIPVKPEQLTSYEAGVKQRFGDLVSVDVSAFYYDYKDSQAFQYDGTLGTATTFNRDATVYGAELEAHARPVKGLELGLLVSYLDATLKDVNLPSGGAVVDTRMPLSPKWTVTGLAAYTVDLGGSGSIRIGGDVTRRSSQYFDAYNSPYHYEPGYTVANASVSWTSQNGKLELEAFAKNIGDTVYRTYSFDLSVSLLATDVWGRPQWFGGGATFRF
ncbi:TonB-dependent receptor [Sphingomonas sp.]|uniref:TonB-dependent receptor n=1 Tax=Sphingomonas sp. TaxID=28214 RepID=UPI001B1112BE|nr:TonB-dependent receptor [Sphingomonas sp.]MBO9711665.1 TonB-dependent receptor [Sphingomonas sp.]